MIENIEVKLEEMKALLFEMGSVLIAYSGGVDSTLLLKVAHDVLGENVLAVTAKSPLYPASELESAIKTSKELGVRHLIIESDELKIPEFANNPKDRCYICKRDLFSKLTKIAKEYNISYILDGSNADDISDFRPGRKAAEEFGIHSLLEEVGLTKDEIRKVSKMMNLPTYDKPPAACLASRFPYGKQITYEALKMVESAEDYIRELGVSQVRVRHYENLCRIETPKDEMGLLLKMQDKVVEKLKELGYTYVTLDLEGYRRGSMNLEHLV